MILAKSNIAQKIDESMDMGFLLGQVFGAIQLTGPLGKPNIDNSSFRAAHLGFNFGVRSWGWKFRVFYIISAESDTVPVIQRIPFHPSRYQVPYH